MGEKLTKASSLFNRSSPNLCYYRRTGLASLLMGLHEEIAKNLPPITKVMLTVFVANQRAHRFYQKLGFEQDAISPVPRRLRFGKIFTPDYIIMSKRVSGAGDDDGDDDHPSSEVRI